MVWQHTTSDSCYLHAVLLAEHPWLQNAKKAPNVPLGDVVKSRLKQFSMMNRFKRKALRVSWIFLFDIFFLCSGVLLRVRWMGLCYR